jgi:hypothetical protein
VIVELIGQAGANRCGKTVAIAVSNYGASVKPKVASVAIDGAPEDQLRGPLDVLIRDLAELACLLAPSSSWAKPLSPI